MVYYRVVTRICFPIGSLLCICFTFLVKKLSFQVVFRGLGGSLGVLFEVLETLGAHFWELGGSLGTPWHPKWTPGYFLIVFWNPLVSICSLLASILGASWTLKSEICCVILKMILQ